ncbi:hypothetical protein [Flavobacterium beibuense]|uniref:hypothetical protein n=1 Tax=Flavobacterium beibuense TaxID=657326 RepID=UPI003A93FCAC
MLNKSNTNNDKKNRALTPEEVKEILDNLPHNYIMQVQQKIGEKIQEGAATKNYSKAYINRVKKGEAFNELILTTMVEVGQANKEATTLFGFKKKKTPLAN